MRAYLILGSAVAAIAGARVARVAAELEHADDTVEVPYAPSSSAAPFVSLGYREAVADLMWIRLVGYFGSDHSDSDGVSRLVFAIMALDPQFERPIEWGARATTMAHYGVGQQSYLHAIAILDAGTTQFPDDWRLPYLEGQIYTQDLETKDPAQRHAWDDKGTLLVESAIRKPGAPPDAAEWAAVMRTRLGQHQHAIDGLKEMLLVTGDGQVRDRLIQRLADLEHSDATQLHIEFDAQRDQFNREWMAARPEVPQTMYILVGPRPAPGIDMSALATGGRDLMVPDDEPLEPPPD